MNGLTHTHTHTHQILSVKYRRSPVGFVYIVSAVTIFVGFPLKYFLIRFNWKCHFIGYVKVSNATFSSDFLRVFYRIGIALFPSLTDKVNTIKII